MSTNCHTVQGQNRKYLRMTFTSSGANYTAKSKLPTAATATLPRKNYECPKKLPGFFQRNSRTFKRNNRHSSKLQQQRHSKFLLFAKNSRLFGFEPIVSPLKRTRRSKQALTRALCSSNQSQYCQKGKQKWLIFRFFRNYTLDFCILQLVRMYPSVLIRYPYQNSIFKLFGKTNVLQTVRWLWCITKNSLHWF